MFGGAASGAEPVLRSGPSGIGAAAAEPMAAPKQSAVDETRIVILVRTVVMAGKASHSRAAKPGSGEIARELTDTHRHAQELGMRLSDSVTATAPGDGTEG